jgi:hypothetical protein
VSILVPIRARGTWNGLLARNSRPLTGLLVVRSVCLAALYSEIGRTVVSINDEALAGLASAADAEVRHRLEELDDTSMFPVMRRALAYLDPPGKGRRAPARSHGSCAAPEAFRHYAQAARRDTRSRRRSYRLGVDVESDLALGQAEGPIHPAARSRARLRAASRRAPRSSLQRGLLPLSLLVFRARHESLAERSSRYLGIPDERGFHIDIAWDFRRFKLIFGARIARLRGLRS